VITLFGSAEPRARAQRQWTLRQRVTALCVLTATVLTFLAAGATTTAMANRDQLDFLIDQIGPMRNAADDFHTALIEQQTSVRSYVLNGRSEDLDRYREEMRRESEAAAAIAVNEAATAQIKDLLRSASDLARQWRVDIADPAITARLAGDRTAAEARLNDPDGVQFEAVQAAALEMRESTIVVRDAATASIKDTSTTLLFVLVVAVILVVAAGVALILALQTTVVGPITELADQVRRVAQGRYDTEIASNGPPELQHLAGDVDSMRRQIAADLAEVEAARHQIEQANVLLEQQAAELVRSNRDLEQFAYVASHDLQEPLRKVASFCQLLQRRYQGQLDERADQYISYAVNGAQRMQRLVADLLEFSRIGRAQTAFADVDLNRVVADEVAQLDLGADPDGADVTWSDLPVVRGEEPLLATLFANLIGNAMKFRRPGAPARASISARLDGDRWEISCTDNGIGIDEQNAERVFVIFSRLNARDTYPGTGIGLAIAKKIVEYHGGTIRIDTTYSGGAAIRFTLPVAAPTDPSVWKGTLHAESGHEGPLPRTAESAGEARDGAAAVGADRGGDGIGETVHVGES
jgi:signal transduction histidine kinase